MFWPFNVNLNRKKISMVCFDLDDTLCDSSSVEAETEVHLISLIHKDLVKASDIGKIHNEKINNWKTRKPISKNNFSNLSTMDLLKLFNEIKQIHVNDNSKFECYSRKLWIDELLKKISANKLYSKSSSYESEYWKYFNSNAKLYSNTIYVLDYLKSKKIKISMITNSDGDKGLKLSRIKRLGIENYFDYIITSDDTGKHKPDISNWQLLIEKSKIDPKECMMVGDRPDLDLINPKKLGMITVWTKQHINLSIKNNYVDYEIRDIQEICNILKNFN